MYCTATICTDYNFQHFLSRYFSALASQRSRSYPHALCANNMGYDVSYYVHLSSTVDRLYRLMRNVAYSIVSLPCIGMASCTRAVRNTHHGTFLVIIRCNLKRSKFLNRQKQLLFNILWMRWRKRLSVLCNNHAISARST